MDRGLVPILKKSSNGGYVTIWNVKDSLMSRSWGQFLKRPVWVTHSAFICSATAPRSAGDMALITFCRAPRTVKRDRQLLRSGQGTTLRGR